MENRSSTHKESSKSWKRTVELSGCRDKPTLFVALQEALGLPEYFGKNWDAFADCLQDKDARWWPQYPRIIEYVGWKSFSGQTPELAEMLHELMIETMSYWEKSSTPLSVVFED